MHILFLTDNFPPEINAPASRTFEHCKEWKKSGVDVTVITCAPNFPMGELHDGYKNQLWQVEEIHGIRVVRVKTYITQNKGSFKRILDFMSFMLAAILASIFVRKVDVIIATSPQFFTAIAGYVSSRLKGVPWVFELRDIWPESIVEVGAMKRGLLIKALERVEVFLYRHADLIIPVTHSFSTYLENLGVSKEKIHVITNGIDQVNFYHRKKNPKVVKSENLNNKFVIGYIGTHGVAHCLETILDAASACQNDSSLKNVHFLFVGDGAEKKKLQCISERLALKNVSFLPPVSKAAIPDYWSTLDLSIIHLKKTKLFTAVLPSKLFEAIGMGIPILLGVQGEASELIENFSVGTFFEPENAESLYRKIKDLTQDPQRLLEYQKNATAVAKHFSRSELAAEMLIKIRHVVLIKM